MARPYEFPDPKDRSVNNPHVLVERHAILGLYNQANAKDKKERVVECVKKWFENEARSRGWDTVQFIENPESAVILGANVYLGSKTKKDD